MINRLLAGAMVALFFACGGETKQETEKDQASSAQIKEEVMAIHDEVMPKMGELRKVEKALRATADSVIVLDSVAAQKHIAAADRIKKANSEMMVWMRQFEPNYEGTEEEVRVYLQEQKLKIKAVADSMNTSMAEGEKLILQQ
jgi:hypothetical protein